MGSAVQSELQAGDDIVVMGEAGIGDGGTGTRADSAPVPGGYESLDADATKKTYEELNAVLDNLAATAVQTLDRMVTYLAKMQSLLSQRGADRKKVLKKAGLPTWTNWAKAYAARFDRSFRTVQALVGQFNSAQRGSGTSGGAGKRSGKRDRAKLDARQQAALVKAQLATSDLVAALEKGGDWQTPLAAYKEVAVSPAKLDSYMEAFNSEPDWKGAFTRLVEALDPCVDLLPAPAKDAFDIARRLLGSEPSPKRQAVGKSKSPLPKRTPVPKAKESGDPCPEKLPTGNASAPAFGIENNGPSAVVAEGQSGDSSEASPVADPDQKIKNRRPEKHEPPAQPHSDQPRLDAPPSSKLVHETFLGGPKVLEVPVLGGIGEVQKLKYYVCYGEEKQMYPMLGEAKAACDRIAERERDAQAEVAVGG